MLRTVEPMFLPGLPFRLVMSRPSAGAFAAVGSGAALSAKAAPAVERAARVSQPPGGGVVVAQGWWRLG